MKFFALLASALLILGSVNLQAQTADEVIDTYLETIGGKEALSKVKAAKMIGKVNQGGMEIPVEMVQVADGRMYIKGDFQGQTFWQNVFDGEVVWNTNFQTMAAEKADTETAENMKRNVGDFPDVFLDYKDKGFEAELVGEETFEGSETYKIALTRKPQLVDGEEVPRVTYYYFDKEVGILLGVEEEAKSGPVKGQISQTIMTDWDEVEGVYFPFTITQGVKGNDQKFPIMLDSIIVNPQVDESVFAFPEK